MLCACSPDSDSMESRIADTMVLLDMDKEKLHQDGLKEILAGVDKGDALFSLASLLSADTGDDIHNLILSGDMKALE